MLQKLCSTPDFFALMPRQWGTNMIVRCMLFLVQVDPEAAILVPGAGYTSSKNTQMGNVESAYILVVKMVLSNSALDVTAEKFINDRLGNRWWELGAAAIRALPGRKRRACDETPEQLEALTVEDQKYVQRMLKETDWSYEGLPKPLREALSRGAYNQQNVTLLAKRLAKLHSDLFKIRSQFVSDLKSGVLKDKRGYVQYFRDCKR